MESNELFSIYKNQIEGIKVGCEGKTVLEIPQGVTSIFKRAFSFAYDAKVIILPDGMTHIKESAFEGLKNLEKIYIPKSVEIIEKDAFKDCTSLKIYCEGEPKEGWVNGKIKRTIREEYVTDEDDAFNFHRSSGGWTSHVVYRDVEVEEYYNPEKAEIFTNIPREKFEKII